MTSNWKPWLIEKGFKSVVPTRIVYGTRGNCVKRNFKTGTWILLSVKCDFFVNCPLNNQAFKHNFKTCASNLADGLPPGQNTALIMPQGTSWSLKHTTEMDILKIIRSLKNKNSAGVDGLSNRMLKREAYRFSVLLKPLINESIDNGIFPKCLKIANIIPIH